MATVIPAEREEINSPENLAWNGELAGDIRITIYGKASQSSFQTNFLANEFGDIDYFFKNVKPHDPSSFRKWVTTGNSQYPGYFNDATGAGQMSFKYQSAFELQFKIIAKKIGIESVDFQNWIFK